jgi:HEAT repeat protein
MHLIAALKDKESYIRIEASGVLGRIRTPAVGPLIAVLKDDDPSARSGALDALGTIGTPAVRPLIAALKDKEPHVRIGAAAALGKIKDAPATEALMAALKDENLEIIAAAYSFFIQKGVSGSETLLIKALDEYGDRTQGMAQDFLNCGNVLLAEAGKKWAIKYGQDIQKSPASHSGPIWGKQ